LSGRSPSLRPRCLFSIASPDPKMRGWSRRAKSQTQGFRLKSLRRQQHTLGASYEAMLSGLSLPLSNPILTGCNVVMVTTPMGRTGLKPESRRELRRANSRGCSFQIGERARGGRPLKSFVVASNVSQRASQLHGSP
jgi:hypothetical protein